jgi:hypothetical protein
VPSALRPPASAARLPSRTRFRSFRGRLLGRGARLPPGLIDMTRLKDANAAEPSKAVVRSLGWHPGGGLLFTAGLDKTLRLFKVRCTSVCVCLSACLPVCSRCVSVGVRPSVCLFQVRCMFACVCLSVQDTVRVRVIEWWAGLGSLLTSGACFRWDRQADGCVFGTLCK